MLQKEVGAPYPKHTSQKTLGYDMYVCVYIYMWRSHVSRESLLDFRLDAQTTSLASTGSTRTDPTSLAVETGHPGLEGELHRDVLPIVWTK